ncbi:MAG: hypothetical protein HFH68_01425 [Lachnospiraceae bacterium]|nr:hypothetical protein [Lachnospiraceae bacterium]
MSTIELEITSNQYVCKFYFERRINVIKGDSGTGKTSLLELIRDTSPDIIKNITLDVLIADDLGWKALMTASHDAIIIFDDSNVIDSAEFAKCCYEYVVKNNLYLLIFNRENLKIEQHTKEAGYMPNISYSIDSIYRLCSDGLNHWLEPFYNLKKCSQFSGLDICITEDTSGGFEFFSKLLNTVQVEHSDGGKSAIVDKIEKLPVKDKNILVIFDSAAFGCEIERFVNKLRDYDLAVLDSYECFEGLLLCSNMFRNNQKVINVFKDLPAYANKYCLSWETFFEKLLAYVTREKPYKYVHGKKLRKCYFEDCGSFSFCTFELSQKCGLDVRENKLEWLLTDTKYSYLLAFHKNENCVTKKMSAF